MDPNYPLEISSTSKINNNRSTNQELFLDHNLVGLGGCFSFHQLNYGINNMELSPNSNNNSLCFIPGSSSSSQMMSELNSSTMLHSVFQTPNTKHVDGIQQQQQNNNYYDHAHQVEDIKWCEYLNAPFFVGNNTVQHQTTATYSDNIMNNDVKQETGFITDESSSNTNTWQHHNQHFQLSASSDIYSKDLLQRFSLAFGQTL